MNVNCEKGTIMTLIEILQGLQNGSFHQGEVLESDIFTVEMLSENRFLITFISGGSELWRRVTSLPVQTQSSEMLAE
jgi:hypothetical protein